MDIIKGIIRLVVGLIVLVVLIKEGLIPIIFGS